MRDIPTETIWGKLAEIKDQEKNCMGNLKAELVILGMRTMLQELLEWTRGDECPKE